MVDPDQALVGTWAPQESVDARCRACRLLSGETFVKAYRHTTALETGATSSEADISRGLVITTSPATRVGLGRAHVRLAPCELPWGKQSKLKTQVPLVQRGQGSWGDRTEELVTRQDRSQVV